MKKKILIALITVVLVISLILVALPHIVIYGDSEVTFISYSDDISRFEDVECYDESYYYYEDLDISIHDFEVDKKGFLYFITLEYEEGNICETEYLLEESYIKKFLSDAVIEENANNIDLEQLIFNKKAIVGNIKYFGNEYNDAIYYTLDGRANVMYIFYVDDLLVVQVGHSDEGPKFIAYK